MRVLPIQTAHAYDNQNKPYQVWQRKRRQGSGQLQEKGELAELQVSGEINYQKEVERICEQEGHVWKETNADCESGTSDLECERCHKFQVLHW